MFIFKYNNRVDNSKNIEYTKPVIRDTGNGKEEK